MKERELIQCLSSMAVGAKEEALLCGIGDDCAVVRSGEGRVLLYSMDTLQEGVHFDLSWHPLKQLGRKSVTVNVSDIAAMGGRPKYFLFSLGIPPGFADARALQLSEGVVEACALYDCQLIGGDTVASPAGLSLTLTVIGEAREGQVVYRHGAQLGDIVYVSGPLGLSAAGLALFQAGEGDLAGFSRLYRAHCDPLAQVALGQRLAKSGLVNAMMDLSDGLATDLAHLCARSGLGARIFRHALPLDDECEQAAALLGRESLEWMISGGEDYALLLTAPKDAKQQLLALGEQAGQTLYPLGEMVQGAGVELVDAEGYARSVSYRGFDHFS